MKYMLSHLKSVCKTGFWRYIACQSKMMERMMWIEWLLKLLFNFKYIFLIPKSEKLWNLLLASQLGNICCKSYLFSEVSLYQKTIISKEFLRIWFVELYTKYSELPCITVYINIRNAWEKSFRLLDYSILKN